MAQAQPLSLPATPPPRIDVRLVDLLIAVAGAVGGILAAFVILVVVAVANRRYYDANGVTLVLVATIVIYAGLFAGMFPFVRRLPNAARWLGLRWPRASDYGLVGGLLVLWFIGEAIIVTAITAGMNHGQPVQSNVRDMFDNRAQVLGILFLALLAGAVVAPICEELFFRGMLYRYLLRRWPVWAAIGVSASIFAVLHFIPMLIPVFLFMGLLLTIQYEITGSLTNSMLLHAAGNGVTILLVYASLTR